MGNNSILSWVIVLAILLGMVWLVRLLLRLAAPMPDEVANTFKFRTVVFIVLAFSIPLWLITLPLFLYLAYKSYAAGMPHGQATEQSKQSTAPQNVALEIEALHKLLISGALSEEEFQTQKARLLGTRHVA
ncbi:SHOCT domain-containing protein [Comamonas sp.]|uniref:SHOCT domain-containing protein n=1 Tax=Comamonas sp. TaxID=34028 RepID=UPI002582B799|nr:SHOCT domain-containing protein [Comamonas sp.]